MKKRLVVSLFVLLSFVCVSRAATDTSYLRQIAVARGDVPFYLQVYNAAKNYTTSSVYDFEVLSSSYSQRLNFAKTINSLSYSQELAMFFMPFIQTQAKYATYGMEMADSDVNSCVLATFNSVAIWYWNTFPERRRP